MSDKVLVVLSGSEAERNQKAGYLLDLAFFFDRVRAVALPPGETLAGSASKDFGTERVNDLLVNSRPLMTYRAAGPGFLALHSADRDHSDRRVFMARTMARGLSSKLAGQVRRAVT